MWHVLGKSAVLVQFPYVWKERMIELSARRKGRARFLELMEIAKINHSLNTQDNIHVFIIEFPEDIPKEDIDLFTDMIRRVRKGVKPTMVAFEGEPQLVAFIVTSEDEPDVIGKRKVDSAAAAELFHRITSTWKAE